MEYLRVILLLVIVCFSINHAKSIARLKRDRLFEYQNIDNFIIDMAIPRLQLSISECLYHQSTTNQLKCIESFIIDEFNDFKIDSMKIKNENPELFQDYFNCIDTQTDATKSCQLKVAEIQNEFYQSLIDNFIGDKNKFKYRLINSQLDLILWKVHLCSHQHRNLSKHESNYLRKLLKTFLST